jgi:hypothetical protein
MRRPWKRSILQEMDADLDGACLLVRCSLESWWQASYAGIETVQEMGGGHVPRMYLPALATFELSA